MSQRVRRPPDNRALREPVMREPRRRQHPLFRSGHAGCPRGTLAASQTKVRQLQHTNVQKQNSP